MEVLTDLETALHLTDEPTSSAASAVVTSNNNSSSSCSSSCNLNSNTIVTQAIISSPSRAAATAVTSLSSSAIPCDANSQQQIDVDVTAVIVKQPMAHPGTATPIVDPSPTTTVLSGSVTMLNNNNDLAVKDRQFVQATVVGNSPPKI